MKYIIIILLLLLPTTFAQDDFYLDRDGWCSGISIPFTVYNQSEWEDRRDIEDDKDKNFSKLSFEITIFDGPFDALEPIYEKTFKDTISPSFEVTFEEEKPYLIEIKPTKGNFSYYDEQLEIRKCKTFKEETYNLSLEIESELTLDIKNTELKDTSDLIIEKKTNLEFELDEEYQVYEFSGNENLTGEVEISLILDSDKDISEVYIINRETKELTLIESRSLEDNQIKFSLDKFEIFTLFQSNSVSEPTIIIDNTTLIIEEEEITQNESIEKPKEELESSSSILDLSVWIILGIVILLFVILAPKIFGTKTQKETYHEDRDKDVRKQITSSKEAYEKTKEYVVKYKLQYPRESIEKALKASGVTEEIIKLVFSEEY
jgi:hypothetical protein